MRTLLVFGILIVAIRLATFLPETHTALEAAHAGAVASQHADLGSLLVAFGVAGLPLIGIVALFRGFGRWHRGFHASMRGAAPQRGTGRGR